MSDVEVTEITELTADDGVHGVGKPANGIGFILVKSAEMEECSTCNGKGTILEGNRKCPDCKGSGEVAKSDSKEADEQEEEMTGELDKGAYCGDPNCGICKAMAVVKDLSESDRKAMPASSFAFIDKNGKKHLPVHDEGHVKSALGRFNQQDFSEAKGDPADAKKKAAAKILSAAKKHGIEVSDESNVAEAAKKGDIQDSLKGTQEPTVAAKLDGGESGLAGSVTLGVRTPASDPSLHVGGRSTANIPLEGVVHDNLPIPETTDGAGIVAPEAIKAVAVASLWEAMDQIEANRQAIKDGQFMQATGDAALSPGSMPWESFDAATLKQIAECLASCCNALDYMAQREREESLTADPGDITNAWDLEEAGQALDCALGVVARLSFHEAVEGEATKGQVAKVGRKLSGKNADSLKAARDHLNSVLESADENKAGSSGDDDKETIDMASVTKDELVELVVKTTRLANEGERKERKAAKKRKEEEAEKNANNGGDISTEDVKPTSEHDADDVQSVGGSVDPQYVNKGTEGDTNADMDPAVKQVADQLGELTKGLRSVEETVAKIAKRARPVGPSLDGQARGLAPDEGRLGTVAKAEDHIEELKKALDAESDPLRKSQIAEELSIANLAQFYRGRGLGGPAIPTAS